MAKLIVLENVRIGESLAERLDKEFPGDWEFSQFTQGRFATAIGDLIPEPMENEFIEILDPEHNQTPFGVDHVLVDGDLEGDYTFQIGIFIPEFGDNTFQEVQQ